MSGTSRFLSLLLALFYYDVALSQDNSNGAMHGANLERTGVYATKGVSHPDEKGWESEKLFVMKRAAMAVSQGWDYSGGPPPFNLPAQTYVSSFGFGYSPPVVVDGTIYFTLFIGDGHLFAVDAGTGKLKWKTIRKKGRFSYPAIAGDYLFVGADNFFYALDLKMQREIWKYEIGDSMNPHSSPAVAGGMVYFGSVNGNFYALDEKTGQAKWVLKTGSNAYWVSPAISGETVYCAESGGRIYALNAKTGAEKWRFENPKGAESVAVADDVVYIVDYDGFISAVDARDGKLKPDFRKRNRTETALAIYDGMLYFGGWHGGNVYAVDAKTGEGRWKFAREEPCSSPVIADGMVNFTCADQRLYALDAKTGKKSWAVMTKQEVMSVPTVANGMIYFISDDGKLHAIK